MLLPVPSRALASILRRFPGRVEGLGFRLKGLGLLCRFEVMCLMGPIAVLYRPILCSVSKGQRVSTIQHWGLGFGKSLRF